MIIGFGDFKKLALENNKRIYYYQRDNILEMCYITEGMYIKSFIDITMVTSKESFFGDDLFIGATKLLFRITEDSDTKSISDVLPTQSVIEENVTEEVKAKEHDLQKDGVKTLQD